MSKRTLVGSFGMDMRANGQMEYKDHVIFAFESRDQTKSWRIEEIQV